MDSRDVEIECLIFCQQGRDLLEIEINL